MTLDEWGWDASWEAQAAKQGVDSSRVARVLGQDRRRWTIQAAHGPEAARVLSAAGIHPSPVVGDWVVCEPGPTPTDPWSLHAVLPRRSQLSRGMAGTGDTEQVLAANLDKIWIVHGLDVELNPRRIERSLAVAWESGATPEILLTKADLIDDADLEAAQVEAIAPGVPVRSVSANNPDSVEQLRMTLLVGSTVCLLGPSGVGKSTLVNALAGGAVARTGDVRPGDHKGRHTTTRRELFRIPGGACLVDNPGIRELRIWSLGEGLSQVFPDIEALAGECRFRDCRHATEPGCAVQEAVLAGRLDPERLSSFRKLQAEAAYERRKADPLARAAAIAEHKSIWKSLKHHPKFKKPS